VEQRHVSVAWFNHLSTENARLNRDLQDVVESAYEEFSALREAAAELRRASVNWFNHLSAENLMRQQELQRDVQFAQQEFNNIWTAGEEHQDAILWLGARADRMEEVVAVIMAEQAVAKDRVDKAESWVDAHNSMILQLHKDAASRFEGVQGEFDALRNDQHVTQERVHVLEKQIDLSRKYMMHLEQETASNFRFVLGRIFEVSTAVEANDADIRVQADVVNSLGGRVSDLETHTEATESSIWCIREDVTGVMEQIDDACKLIGNVQEQCDASTKRIGNIDKQAHTSDNLVTDILKLVNESFREAQQVQTQVKGVTERLLAMQATMDEFKEWITYANDKFQRVYQEVGKVSMALGSMKVCSTLHKDHLIQLYDKVYPELAKTLIESYSYLKRQSGNVIKAEVVFSKTLQDALIRVISEKYTSALVQSGDIKEQLATLQGQVAGLQESARVGAAGAQDALGDRLEERLPESLEQELMPAPLRIQKKQPAAKSLQDMYTDVSGGASSAEALTDKLLAELEAA
jgi:chromosome segregation ATPase